MLLFFIRTPDNSNNKPQHFEAVTATGHFELHAKAQRHRRPQRLSQGFGLGLTHEKLNGRFFIWYPPILMGFGRWFCGFLLELRWFLFHEQVKWDCPTDWLWNQQSIEFFVGFRDEECGNLPRFKMDLANTSYKTCLSSFIIEKLPSSATYRSKRGIQRRHNMFPFIRRTGSPPYFLSLLLSQDA
jgi:hypothetical protein